MYVCPFRGYQLPYLCILCSLRPADVDPLWQLDRFLLRRSATFRQNTVDKRKGNDLFILHTQIQTRKADTASLINEE